MQESYLQSVLKQFEYYKTLGEKTFEQLSDEDLFWNYNKESNSIAVIVNHLSGNMKSRWTDFLTADGEKSWRNRDMEFEEILNTRKDISTKWNEGWDILFSALRSINAENFNSKIFIRNQEHTIPEAINRQMMHYAYHVGQIVYIGRMAKGDHWKSLSIPKGDSQAFNKKKFDQGTHKGHFTDDIK
ncbi:DUF1572 domain-containing protein [Dokdonia sinensis]|uniref:DUF1572 domain-containing protein n=1 Tax=Dokdonia sinensis TaxID=2479847 RepID=A0A3M0GDY5_9FLAO|nr:DUF1572 family protein [Dokdonia sinensis]RMB63381.1 DUF1572 domain-containing protein [Dokdonia sinensis]